MLDQSRSMQEPCFLVLHSWNGSPFLWIFATPFPCHRVGLLRQWAETLLVFGDHERVCDENRITSSYPWLSSTKVQHSGKTWQRSNRKLEASIAISFANHPRCKLPGRSDTCFRLLAISKEHSHFHLILRAAWYSRWVLRRSSSFSDRIYYPQRKQAITGRLDRYDVVILCCYLLNRTTHCWHSCPTTWHPHGRILGWVLFVISNGAGRSGCVGEAEV